MNADEEPFPGSADDMMNTIATLRAQNAELVAALEAMTKAARGLSCGIDWNNGTHAKLHGYREKLLAVLPIAEAALAGHMHGDEKKSQTIYPEDTTEDDLISRVGCMFFDAMTVKCVAGDYAKSVVAMVRSHDRHVAAIAAGQGEPK